MRGATGRGGGGRRTAVTGFGILAVETGHEETQDEEVAAAPCRLGRLRGSRRWWWVGGPAKQELGRQVQLAPNGEVETCRRDWNLHSIDALCSQLDIKQNRFGTCTTQLIPNARSSHKDDPYRNASERKIICRKTTRLQRLQFTIRLQDAQPVASEPSSVNGILGPSSTSPGLESLKSTVRVCSVIGC